MHTETESRRNWRYVERDDFHGWPIVVTTYHRDATPPRVFVGYNYLADACDQAAAAIENGCNASIATVAPDGVVTTLLKFIHPRNLST
jgi:hypothetical protein